MNAHLRALFEPIFFYLLLVSITHTPVFKYFISLHFFIIALANRLGKDFGNARYRCRSDVDISDHFAYYRSVNLFLTVATEDFIYRLNVATTCNDSKIGLIEKGSKK